MIRENLKNKRKWPHKKYNFLVDKTIKDVSFLSKKYKFQTAI